MKKLIFEKFKANIIDSAMTISIVGGKKTCCWVQVAALIAAEVIVVQDLAA